MRVFPGFVLLATLAISHATGRRKLGKSKSKGPSTSPALRPGDCLVCDRDNKDRPNSLTFEYIPGPGANSVYQSAEKADCRMNDPGSYPDSPDLSVDGQTINLDADNEFTLQGGFSAFTHFDFGPPEDFSCFIHTSCSQPLVVGDQFGPFKLVGPDTCGDPGPGVPCDEQECVICDRDNKNRPTSLTFRFHTDGENSAYQDSSKASCRMGTYPEGMVTASDKSGNVIDSFDLSDGSEFTLTSDRFDSETTFTFSDTTSCFIHTSCSAPLVRGDQIGPFELLAGNQCLPCPAETPAPTPPVDPRPCCEVLGRYDSGRIIVDFRNQCTNPDMTAQESMAFVDDWVGLYPCDYEVDTDFPTHSPRPNNFQGAWMYTCYQAGGSLDENCQNTLPPEQTVRQGTMVFERSTAPGYSLSIVYGHLSNPPGRTNYDANGDFPPGCYVAIMNHNDGESEPPAYIACQGNDFMVG